MPEKNQKMRFNKEELALMKNTFDGNDELLFTLRKFFLGFELSELETGRLSKISGDVLKLVNKIFNPTIDPASPLFQLVDMKLALNVDFKEHSSEIDTYLDAKQIEINYITGKLAELAGGKGEYKTFKELEDLSSPNRQVNLIARNYLLSYIDSYCNEIKFLAFKREDETNEQAMERMKKDSTK